MKAQTPPMGFNTWNRFLDANNAPDWEAITHKSVVDLAKAMVDSGLKDAGYEYFVMDDGFQGYSRDSKGRVQGHARRFRPGVEELVAEVKSLGLKMGIYAVPGRFTCGQQYQDYHGLDLGSLGYEEIDAQAFADWGIDYLKYDWCRAHINDGLDAPAAFRKMADALAKYAPDVVYSISEYGLFESHKWAPEFTNLWRTTDDLFASWDSLVNTIDQQIGLESYSSPGRWNDPDMLQIGNGTLTFSENRAHMIIWAILNAPLMAGNDLVNMTDEVRGILTHKGLIAVNQDWGGRQGKLIAADGGLQVWEKPMSDGTTALAFLNRGERAVSVKASVYAEAATKLKDVWSGDGASASDVLEVEPHGALLVIVS